MPGRTRARVVVVGGGFAGVAAVRALAQAPVDVTLVDRRGRHVFQPLLYRVALGDLAPCDVVVPLDALLREQRNATVLVDEVRGFDAARRRVALPQGELAYDALVVAAGAAPAYLGHDGWRALAPALHTLEDALDIRARLRGALASAVSERDPVRRAEWLTFVVVGGGPTGIELAGGIAELVAGLPRGHAGRAARVVLLERGRGLLPSYPASVARRAAELLERLGVEVHTRAAVAGVDAKGVRLPGERIAARTVLWAAGMGAARVGALLDAPVDGAGRVEVRADLSVPGLEGVYAVGDVASIALGDGRVPSTAAAAIQAGRHAAANVVRAAAGERTHAFRFHELGRLAAVGKGVFVGHLGPFELPTSVATLVARATHARWLWPVRAPAELPALPALAGARTG
ncbi:MAG: NAD(P)/FAD-dependent oxidoreductase [Anaeromyxobacteraceae bacterium]